MFQPSRDEFIRATEWNPQVVQYVEAWKYENLDISTPQNFRHGSLKATQIKEWLDHEGKFSVPTPPPSAGKIEGGIRLLICDRTSFQNVSLGISKESFHAIESTFQLHPATLPALEVVGGTFSRHIKYTTRDHSKIDKISVILKAPQKYEIANYMLSLTHDTVSRWTTALLAGESVMDLSSSCDDSKALSNDSHAPFATIRTLLSPLAYLWAHPLLLPCVVMTDHLNRLHRFCAGQLTEQVMAIEDQLGITRVGRRKVEGRYKGANIHAPQQIRSGGPVGRSQAMDLTIKINSQSTKVLFSKRSPTWNCDASDFLLAVVKELAGKLGDVSPDCNQIPELLEHNIQIAKSVEEHVIGLQMRLDLQLNVLYSFVAQMDNRLSARLAATSGRDSTSMKILAFITTLFLPGTFVATLFSMSMFDWQHDGSDINSKSGSAVVSSRLWIYWAVAAPLTVLTLTGWALWWSFEKHRYDLDVADTLRSAESLDEPSWWRKLARKRDKPSQTENSELVTAPIPQRTPWSDRKWAARARVESS